MIPASLRVVVLSYGAGEQAVAVVESLAREGLDPGRILVVHNPSSVGEAPPRLPAQCEIVLASHNLGYAAAMNLGIERQLVGDCELLLLLTHDAALRAGCLGQLVAAAQAEPRFGAIGPVLLYTGSEDVFSFGGVDRADGDVEHRKVAPSTTGPIAPCDWLDGGTVLARAEVLRRVGGFDDRFWGYCEDADLCLRIRRSGFSVGVVLDAHADQAPGGAKRPGPWAYLRTRNGLAYAQRAGGPIALIRLGAKSGVGVAWELARAAARAVGLRSGSPAVPWAVAVGTARGLLDFARGRWGPPPKLPGGGDIGNTSAPESG